MPVLREGGVIRHIAIQTQATKPAIGDVEIHFLAQPALGADAHAVSNDQHPDHQLRINRGAACLAVIGPQVLPDIRQIHEPVDRAQEMIRRYMSLRAEALEQRLLHHRSLAHRRPISACQQRVNQAITATSRSFFNKIGPLVISGRPTEQSNGPAFCTDRHQPKGTAAFKRGSGPPERLGLGRIADWTLPKERKAAFVRNRPSNPRLRTATTGRLPSDAIALRWEDAVVPYARLQ